MKDITATTPIHVSFIIPFTGIPPASDVLAMSQKALLVSDRYGWHIPVHGREPATPPGPMGSWYT